MYTLTDALEKYEMAEFEVCMMIMEIFFRWYDSITESKVV